MTGPTKLTNAVSEIICQHARAGLPLRRAAAMAGVNRITAWRWETQGATEIDQVGDDDDAELGPRALFSLAYGQARAEYLAELNAAWKSAIAGKDSNRAKAIQIMLAAVSPDEFSVRRATRSVNQTTTLQGEIGVTRFAEMSTEDLDAERQRIAARRTAARVEDGDDWRGAVADRPGPAGGDIDPAPAAEEKNLSAVNPERSLSNRKSQVGGLPAVSPASPENILPSRARDLSAPVVDDQAEFVVAAQSTPAHSGGEELTRTSPPFPPDDDDEDTQL